MKEIQDYYIAKHKLADARENLREARKKKEKAVTAYMAAESQMNVAVYNKNIKEGYLPINIPVRSSGLPPIRVDSIKDLPEPTHSNEGQYVWVVEDSQLMQSQVVGMYSMRGWEKVKHWKPIWTEEKHFLLDHIRNMMSRFKINGSNPLVFSEDTKGYEWSREDFIKICHLFKSFSESPQYKWEGKCQGVYWPFNYGNIHFVLEESLGKDKKFLIHNRLSFTSQFADEVFSIHESDYVSLVL